MYGRDGAGMTCVQSLQQVKGFPASNFPYDDSIWPVTQGGFEQIPNGNCRDVVLLSTCLKTNKINPGCRQSEQLPRRRALDLVVLGRQSVPSHQETGCQWRPHSCRGGSNCSWYIAKA